MPRRHDAEVAIVGYGPVGQLLAVLLAKRGWQVTVVEQWARPYPMPRAVAFDGESARILAAAGVGEFISSFGEPSGDYSWENADGQELLHFDAMAGVGRSGWPDSTSMYQPGLEEALIASGTTLPNLRVLRGYTGVDLTEDAGAGVQLVAHGPDGALVLRADWVIGCDGANSFVQRRVSTTVTDFGFHHDWLICDVVPDPPRRYEPNNLQICDPARPRTAVSAGPGHRRWEFMRVAGETVEELNTPQRAWDLLGLFGITPDNATLDRHAVYAFEARYADQWRAGRVMIAGDAAHLMPPFAAQGMSSGFRDAANLAWKLDLILAGVADEAILDTYTVERRQHVQHAIAMSVNLGRVICQTDPAAAADRDAMMFAVKRRGSALGRPPSAIQALADGLLQRTETRPPAAPVGQLAPQGRVTRGGAPALFDTVVGTGFVLVTTEPPTQLLHAGHQAFLRRIGAHLVQVVPDGSAVPDGTAVVDVDNVYLPWLGEAGATAMLVRPDFYVFGAAADRAGLATLMDELAARLSTVREPAPAEPAQSA